MWKGEQRGGEDRGRARLSDFHARVHSFVCFVFDVGRRFVYMWRGLDGPTFSCTCIYIFHITVQVRLKNAQHSSAHPVQ